MLSRYTTIRAETHCHHLAFQFWPCVSRSFQTALTNALFLFRSIQFIMSWDGGVHGNYDES